MSVRRVVVVGGGLAGATTALTLRGLGEDGEVVVVGEEAELPYERPALSKEYLLGTTTADRLSVAPAERYAELGIELRLGCAAAGLDPDRREVVLADGERISYSSAVLATGAANLRPPVPGLDLPGVLQLRTLAEADALRDAAASARRAVVVGMGFIGCEVASSLRTLGLEVTTVDALAGPLVTQLGPRLSELIRGWHEERGVRVLSERSVTQVVRDGAALAVETDAGDRLAADLVVVGVGVRPATGWLAGAPVHLAGGVGVDDDGRTNLRDVWAVGDVAARWDAAAGTHRRSEHWSAALEQGRRVAHAVAGRAVPPSEPPWFWSAQYDHLLQYAGRHEPGSELILREDPLTGFYVGNGTVEAVLAVDGGRRFRALRRVIGRRSDLAALADPSVDVRELAAAQ